jgi:NAD(P)-dependent dehydrogenase (short-subunit alcohol dehydrogenase family)
VIDVHLNGAFNVFKAATPYFREQGSGSFIHFTSTSGLIGNFGSHGMQADLFQADHPPALSLFARWTPQQVRGDGVFMGS